MKTAADTILCANEGCGWPAGPEEIYCGKCDLERMLYRRDLREGADCVPGRRPDELRARPRQHREGPGLF